MRKTAGESKTTITFFEHKELDGRFVGLPFGQHTKANLQGWLRGAAYPGDPFERPRPNDDWLPQVLIAPTAFWRYRATRKETESAIPSDIPEERWGASRRMV